MKISLLYVIYFFLLESAVCGKGKKKKKKDAMSMTDADIYKLDEEWREEDDVDEGDLPEHLRPQKPVDFSKMNSGNPEDILKETKRHKTLMMFVTVSGNPHKDETEQITALWQSQLFNAHIEIERYVISDNRVLIKLKDGSYAYEIKNFLIEQERCENVTIEGKDYPGKLANSTKKKSSKKSKDKTKKSGNSIKKNTKKSKKENKTEL